MACVSAAAEDSNVDAGFPTVRSLAIAGNTAIPTPDLTKRLTVKEGSPLRMEQLQYSISMIESIYHDKGYYEVAVSSALALLPQNQVDLKFEVREGPIFHIGDLRIQGNRIVSQKVILRDLDLHQGDLFSQSKIFDGNRQLYLSGYFETIDFAYSTTTAHTVNIDIKVKEKATRFIKGSTGYGTQTKERVTLGYEDMNFFGNARRLDVTGTWSGFVTNPAHYETKIVQTGLTQPNVFNSRYEGQSNVSREWDRREAYDSTTTAWLSSLGRRFTRKLTASMRYRYSGTRVTRESPDALTPGFTNISAVGPTFTYDDTNDPFLPSVGWRVMGTYEEGLRLIIGDVNFHKLETRVGRYDTGLWGWTLYEDLQAGDIQPASTSDRNIIPIYERYFIGGADTVRGYSERELGPRDTTGAPLGGNAFLVGNVELRHRLYKQLFGVVFFDAGQLYLADPGHVWPHMRIEHIDDFRYASGFGIRFHSPIGAIRLELGYKLNPSGGTGFLDRAGIDFSIGELF
jgi:outer membrane protein insertion porin family